MNQALLSDSYIFRELRFEKDHHTDSRTGAACHYLAYMKKGRCRIVSDSRTVEIREGELFYIPHGCRYQSYWYGEEAVVFDSYGFLVFPNPENRRYMLQVIPHTQANLQLLALLSENKALSCKTLGLFYALLAQLLPNMEYEALNKRETVLAQAERYLSHHPDSSNEAVAKACCVSLSGLYAAFQAEGTTPNALRQKLRAVRAAELLTTTDLPVESISASLGFSSASYFRKVMKRHFGVCPRQIRKSASF